MLSQCNFIKTTAKGNKKTFEIGVNRNDSVNRIVKEKVSEEKEKPKKKFFPYKRRFKWETINY